MDKENRHHFKLENLKQSFQTIKWQKFGKVVKVIGTRIEAFLPNYEIGSLVEIEYVNSSQKKMTKLSEVVGFSNECALLLPYEDLSGIKPGCLVRPTNYLSKIAVGSHLLGRVLDPFLNPLDGNPLNIDNSSVFYDLENQPPNPMDRERIKAPLGLGIKAIDGVLTFGRGQRIGINAGSGVGKSILLGMIAKGSSSDINVIALLGERGREVKEFIQKELGEEGLKKSIVITATSDKSPLVRIRGAKVATAISEYFADIGKNVLLMMDSITRVAMSQREIGSAIGEPPTTKGYTPSVFSLLPRILERAGTRGPNQGSISGIYTVLVDGDNFNDPIADTVRSILDGHINLSRDLAIKGHYPAIDITTSSSRVMKDVISEEHWELSLKLKELVGIYNENKDLLQIGAYQQGVDEKLDMAIRFMPAIENFLKQKIDQKVSLVDSISALKNIFSY